jgi:hypothetical protein
MIKPVIKMSDLALIVSSVTGVSVEDIRKTGRKKHVAVARHILMWCAYRNTIETQEAIARYLNKADHSTVIHGIKGIDNAIDIAYKFGNTENEHSEHFVAMEVHITSLVMRVVGRIQELGYYSYLQRQDDAKILNMRLAKHPTPIAKSAYEVFKLVGAQIKELA